MSPVSTMADRSPHQQGGHGDDAADGEVGGVVVDGPGVEGPQPGNRPRLWSTDYTQARTRPAVMVPSEARRSLSEK